MAKIFISYRRDDSQYQADKLHAALKPYVANPKTDIFIDVDNIPLGVDFATHLEGKVAECEVLLALIGDEWLNIRDPATGQRRLDDPKDFVRIEIASALRRGIPVVPVLFDGASIPPADELPDDLKPLARRNGLPVTRASFDGDMVRLVNGLPIDMPGNRNTRVADQTKTKPAPMALILGGFAVVALGLWIMLLDPLNRFGEDNAQRVTGLEAESFEASEHSEAVSTIIQSPNEHEVVVGDVGEVFRDPLSNGDRGPEMVVIPSGSFSMGSPFDEDGRSEDEGPIRTVQIGYKLAVGKYEVLTSQYSLCVLDEACEFRDVPPNFRFPMTNVDWDDAQSYARWLSRKTGRTYRLLTEAEWEYAARAGTSTPYEFGHDANLGCSHMNGGDANLKRYDSRRTTASCDDGSLRAAVVGSYAANAFGLHDMHGNVSEWVEDCYRADYNLQPEDGSAYVSSGCRIRVIRGGSWNSPPSWLRSARRTLETPDFREDDLGFRVAREIE